MIQKITYIENVLLKKISYKTVCVAIANRQKKTKKKLIPI